MELKDTIDQMQSADYNQVKIRHSKLKKFLMKIKIDENNDLAKNKHDCPTGLLHRQLGVMQDYLNILEERALYENIELE